MLRRTLPLLFATPALAQERPVRLVIAFPPGGSTDILGRLIAPRMGELLGTTVTPENRSGASGAVGAGVVAQAAPDGSTLLLDSGGQAVNPFLMRGLGFDYVTAFAPITLLATLPLVLVVRAELGVTALPALLARLHAEPRLAAYGSVGIGARTHLAMAALLRRAGLTGEHIPYRGGADQVAGLLRGDVAMGFTSIALAAPLLRDGRLMALGYSLPDRTPSIGARLSRLCHWRLAGHARPCRHAAGQHRTDCRRRGGCGEPARAASAPRRSWPATCSRGSASTGPLPRRRTRSHGRAHRRRGNSPRRIGGEGA